MSHQSSLTPAVAHSIWGTGMVWVQIPLALLARGAHSCCRFDVPIISGDISSSLNRNCPHKGLGSSSSDHSSVLGMKDRGRGMIPYDPIPRTIPSSLPSP